MPSDHCYLIISPDPSEDLELEIRGKAYGTTENSKEKPKDRIPIVGKQLHFVKFGDEDNLRNRVNQYRTHNPSCKLSHISIAFDPEFDVSDSLVANNRTHKSTWGR